MTDKLNVTQADRRAAASVCSKKHLSDAILLGRADDASTVQAFARHRLAHSGEGQGWIVGNADGTKWRCWGSTGPEWTDDHEQAIRYARRIDAERTHADDDDAWRIVPYSGEGRSNGAGEDVVCERNILAMIIVELLNMIPTVRSKAGDIIVRRARRAIEGLPNALAQGEANYQAYLLAVREENKPDGTLASLATVATMLDEYGVKEPPANEQGQIDFMRAIMESAVDEIRAFLEKQPAALSAPQGEVERLRDLLRQARPYVANVVEAHGFLTNKRDLEAIDAALAQSEAA